MDQLTDILNHLDKLAASTEFQYSDIYWIYETSHKEKANKILRCIAMVFADAKYIEVVPNEPNGRLLYRFTKEGKGFLKYVKQTIEEQ